MMAALFLPLLDSLSFVLILMLVALGLAVIFGLMNVINMAHGEFVMLGAYVVVVATRGLGAGGVAAKAITKMKEYDVVRLKREFPTKELPAQAQLTLLEGYRFVRNLFF